MQKKFSVLLIIIMFMTLFLPFNVSALNNNSKNISFYDNIYILTNKSKKKAKNDKIEKIGETKDLIDEYDQDTDCSGANSILGDPDDEDSVAWLLQKALDYIKVIGPILVVVLSSIDFILVIIKSDDEAMKKATKKLVQRVILAILLFFIPLLVQVALDLFGMATDPTCGLH